MYTYVYTTVLNIFTQCVNIFVQNIGHCKDKSMREAFEGYCFKKCLCFLCI